MNKSAVDGSGGKPPFDPNKPFQPVSDDTAVKPPFDPNKPFSAAPDGGDAAPQNAWSGSVAEKNGFGPQLQSWEDEHNKNVSEGVKEGVDELPMIGGMAGLVTPLPGASVGGAMLGQAAKDYAKNKLYDTGAKTPGDRALNMVGSGIAQGVGNLAGAAVNKIGGFVANSGVGQAVGKYAKPAMEDVIAAAKRYGVKPTQGMLTDDYVTRGLESSLAQSPSVPGALIRNEQAPVAKALGDAGDRIMSDASSEGGYQAGRTIKKGIQQNFEDRLDPIRKSYQEIESHTKNVELDPKSQDRIAKNIMGIDEARFDGSDGHKIASQFSGWLKQAQDVNDIKLLKTKAGSILRDANASTEAKAAAGQIVDKLEQFQNNSITRGAVQIARDGAETRTSAGKFLNAGEKQAAGDEAEAEGKDLGRRLIGDIKNTNKQYRGVREDLSTFGKGSGMTRANKGPAAALNDIENFNNQDVAPAMFDTGNADFLKFTQEKMPKEFEMARQQKLGEILNKSKAPNGSLDVKKLVKNTEKLDPAVKEILFAGKNAQDLADLGTLTRSLPEKVGASDTPRGLAFKDVINPMQNLKDAGAYGLLKAKPYAPKAGLLIKNSRPAVTGLVTNGLLKDDQ